MCALDRASAHGRADVALELLAVGAQLVGGLFIKRVRRVRFQEEELSTITPYSQHIQPTSTLADTQKTKRRKKMFLPASPQ